MTRVQPVVLPVHLVVGDTLLDLGKLDVPVQIITGPMTEQGVTCHVETTDFRPPLAALLRVLADQIDPKGGE